jgi:hypothetical protein
MDYYDVNEATVTVKKSYLKTLLVVLMVVLLGAGTVTGYVMMRKNMQVQQQVPVASEFTATGLAGKSEGMPSGTILYRTFKASNTTTTPYLGAYSIATDGLGTYTETPFLAAFPVNLTTTLVLQKKAEDATRYQFGFLGKDTTVVTPIHDVTAYQVSDVTMADTNAMYAYSFQTNEVTATDVDAISNWSIAIHTSFSGDFVTVAEAIHPQWVDNNSAVIFMKADGVYKIDIATNEMKKVAGLDDQTFTAFDGLAVSGDATKLIITKAKENKIEVMSLDKNASGELSVSSVGIITSKSVNYSNPLFSPDSQYYSVVATRIPDMAIKDGAVVYSIDSRIETRFLTGAEVIKSIKINDEAKSGVTLLTWLTK